MMKKLCAVLCAMLLALACVGVLAESEYDLGEAAMEAGDWDTAKEHFLNAAQDGDPFAMWALLSIEADEEQATYWYQEAVKAFRAERERLKEAAQQGDVESMRKLGDAYIIFRDEEPDYEQAAYWYQKAAEAGDAEAMASLASLYEYGDGVEQSDELAAYWYEMAEKYGG